MRTPLVPPSAFRPSAETSQPTPEITGWRGQNQNVRIYHRIPGSCFLMLGRISGTKVSPVTPARISWQRRIRPSASKYLGKNKHVIIGRVGCQSLHCGHCDLTDQSQPARLPASRSPTPPSWGSLVHLLVRALGRLGARRHTRTRTNNLRDANHTDGSACWPFRIGAPYGVRQGTRSHSVIGARRHRRAHSRRSVVGSANRAGLGKGARIGLIWASARVGAIHWSAAASALASTTASVVADVVCA